MNHELVKASSATLPAVIPQRAVLPAKLERAGEAGRFAWEEFFFAEHHNSHTQAAYLRAVKRFLAWADGQGVELPATTPGIVGQYLVGLGGSVAKRSLVLSALRGFFDRRQKKVLQNDIEGICIEVSSGEPITGDMSHQPDQHWKKSHGHYKPSTLAFKFK